MEDRKREAPTVPDRRGGSCCGRLGAWSWRGAADAASAAGRRTSELCPGTAALSFSCLHWAVCFWDFSNADVVRGPLSRGTMIPLEAGL